MRKSKFDPEEVRRLYWQENLSTPAIARQMNFGGGAPAVLRYMQRHDIPRRTIGESVAISWVGNDARREWAGKNIGRAAVEFYEKGVATRASQYRQKPSRWEKVAIEHLTSLGEEFEFQVQFGRYIADFVLPSRMLIIEIDSLHHRILHIKERDALRTIYLENLGYTVRRIMAGAERAVSTFKRHIDESLG